MLHIEIRPANNDDSVSLSQIIHELGYHIPPAEIPKQIASNQGHDRRIWVATHKEKVVGFLSFSAIPLFHVPGKWGRITAMGVLSGYKRKGVGRALLCMAEQFATEIGCSRIELTSADHREHEAHKFYESNGYQKRPAKLFAKNIC